METPTQQKNKKDFKGVLFFCKELAKYFMDFLETDFHKRKNPKRIVKLKDNNNLLVGLNLNKYPNFNNVIWKIINNGFDTKSFNGVRKGDYKANIPKNLLDLVKIRVEDINKKEIDEIIKTIAQKLKKFSELYKKEYDQSLIASLEGITEIIKKALVLPFIQKIEKSLENLNLIDEDIRYLMEEELTDVFIKNLENKISEILKLLISEKEVDVSEEIKSVFNARDVKNIIIDFFDDFKIADLFSEILEMNRNRNILDKQEFYLYFYDITFNKIKYPIFYIPFDVQPSKDFLQVDFDAQVYINKKALEYIVQEYNNAREKKGTLKSDTERIIYLAEGKENLLNQLQDLIGELVNFFELNSDLDITALTPQKSKSASVSISNACYLSLFDKSDEALINDYEEILQLLSLEDDILGSAFNKLIDDFINTEPKSFNLEVEEDWEENGISDKLVCYSPIPLNSEQRKIISAMRKKECKYIAVQGPPGTGKSHTITALLFNAILGNKSVLVLSDKKEALDVVEEKITDTMNKVRNDKNFQNPILRLGKTGNTYSQILSDASVKNIMDYYKAVRKDYEPLQNNIKKLSNTLKEDLEAEALIYDELDNKEIQELIALQDYYKNNAPVVDVKESAEQLEAVSQLEEFRKTFSKFRNKFVKNKSVIEFFNFLEFPDVPFERVNDFVEFSEFISLVITNIEKTKRQLGNEKIENLFLIESFSNNQLKTLEKFLDDYRNLKNPVFGYLFKKKKIENLNRAFKKNFLFSKINEPHRNLQKLEQILEVFQYADNFNKSQLNLDYLKVFHRLVSDKEFFGLSQEMISLGSDIGHLKDNLSKYAKTLENIGFNPNSFKSLYENKLVGIDDDTFNKIIRFIFLKQKIIKTFNSIPQYNYINQKQEIENLTTTKMTYLLDGRLVDFYENNKATAKVLREIIRSKQRFPKKEFAKLKEAFPCILAGIRDYAEYIPLKPEIFDLVIIDEASQVSIAQAFPALLRAKQVIIFGDKKQFSNVKSYQARTDTNREYLNGLKDAFKTKISTDLTKLKRLSKFNIKTSILEFFEFISNYNTQLLKHFRGYKEIISYSNKFFYQDSLQVMKIRGKSIDETLKFSLLKHDGKIEKIPNTNKLEIDFISSALKKLAEDKHKCSVGVITPHTNQQKMLIDTISRMPEKDYLFDELNLKIMTFDTCQGEERDIIFYSMVASEKDDRLWGVFIKDLNNVDLEEEGKIKAQRLNVGFSRAKECMHFVLSKNLNEYDGAIGEAIRHYNFALEEAKKEKPIESVDKKSEMEPKVLTWFYQTKFWQDNKDNIELLPQFEIGKYLKQLDKNYTHPAYIVDFLLVYNEAKDKKHFIIIEYDGFEGHFKNTGLVNKFNYSKYYSEDDIYRQKVLEGYGYKFLRLNRFNIGDNPIATLDDTITKLIKDTTPEASFLDNIHNTIEGLKNGTFKECPKCKKVKSIKEFKDNSLITGYGRFCKQCKGISRKFRHYNKSRQSSTSSKKIAKIVDSIKCPRCGNAMVLRSGKYGEFHGCSKFPYCRGTRRIE